MTRLDRNPATVIVVLCTLFLACGGCGEEPVPMPRETDVPWGEAVNGLQCRLLPQIQTVDVPEGM
ncbi:MAG TPA: hypothetical protein VMY39_09480, partial [Planctomycetota bacterium]|nr:hypothetical protein [Planctomycetota bacterium]